MIKENIVLMQEAREALNGKWGLAVGTFLIAGLISGASSIVPFIGSVASLIIGGPLALGLSIFSLNLARKEDARLEQIFKGFDYFGNALGAYILMVIFVMLWMLLLIIPGIIAAISYSQTFFILSENPEMGPMDALKKSKTMMYGYKWKYFCLGLRFFGWALLCVLTLGIGMLWLMPYMQVSYANFYEDIREQPITPELA